MAKQKPSKRSWLDEAGITSQNQRLYLTAYAVTGNKARAARDSGISRSSHHAWLNLEGEEGDRYRAAAIEAKEMAGEHLEGIAHDRATEGLQVKHWHAGKVVGYDTVKSDLLLIFLMKGAMPEKYRDNVNVKGELAGKLTLEQICSAAMKPDKTEKAKSE